jgi:Dolichyl-phosphate-mannose-protein mannosyltransferase
MLQRARANGPPAIVYGACAVTLALGLFFIFVWTPLPWGWHGIDFYYENALALARGESFGTTKIMWGYAYFLAPWYYLFGDRPWIPLVAQAAINASIPLIVYHLARREIGDRVAIVAAALAGILSFNTIYASTQAADAICTPLVAALMLAWGAALRRDGPGSRATRSTAALFAISGILAGVAYQFRPNLVLFPLFLAALTLAVRRTAETLRYVSVFLGLCAAAGLPWIVHAYRSTGLLIPASTHGGRQLWFGTLQTGPFFDNWFANPRSVFGDAYLEYTSLDDVPLVVSGHLQPCAIADARSIELRYWTSRDAAVRAVPITTNRNGAFELSIEPPPAPAAVSYYFIVRAERHGRSIDVMTPERGPEDPHILVVSRDHLGDLDVASQWLDVFDVIRLLRQVAWGDAPARVNSLDLNQDGATDEVDLRRAATLLAEGNEHADRDLAASVERGAESATLRFVDGSTIVVPRDWDGRISSVAVRGALAGRVATRSRTLAGIAFDSVPSRAQDRDANCLDLEDAGINRVLRRQEPHEMRRATALALDNIRREPIAFAAASLKRALRLFVVQGGGDRDAAVQFTHSGTIYTLGRLVSYLYFGLFVCGLIVAVKRRDRLLVLLAPLVYIPITICPMLVTSRYATTMQPFIFVFIAIALVATHDLIRPARAAGTPTETGSLR